MSQPSVRRALVSVSNKSGLETFVAELVQLDFEIVSTGGTRRFLEDHQFPVVDISEYTRFPEMMDGRVKTLHPKVHGAILGRPDLESDAQAMADHEIVPFELVVCNLYPFEETIAKPNVSIADAIEQIDIGGPSMVRSAAKNHAYVGIVTSPSQYSQVIEELKGGRLSDNFRRELAAHAFQLTATYDRAIADYFVEITSADGETNQAFPESLSLSFDRQAILRYGENPHQPAAFYTEPNPHGSTLASAVQIHGKELSFNNLLDLDAALGIAREFSAPAAVVIKHSNPCGCAIAETLDEAFEKAHAGDPVSAFGSIIGFNRQVDAATAEKLCLPNRFVEAIIAPGFESDAVEIITTKPTWKNSVRLMECPGMKESGDSGLDLRRISGGLLVQNRDDLVQDPSEWKVASKRQPTDAERSDLQFAWQVCKHVKSNAIVLATDGAITGVGAGQMSRLDSSYLAAYKAGERSRGCVLASDAFFPFRDGIDEAAKAGVTAVIQPGGSRRDEEVIEACDEHNIALLLTGHRHFRH